MLFILICIALRPNACLDASCAVKTNRHNIRTARDFASNPVQEASVYCSYDHLKTNDNRLARIDYAERRLAQLKEVVVYVIVSDKTSAC